MPSVFSDLTFALVCTRSLGMDSTSLSPRRSNPEAQ